MPHTKISVIHVLLDVNLSKSFRHGFLGVNLRQPKTLCVDLHPAWYSLVVRGPHEKSVSDGRYCSAMFLFLILLVWLYYLRKHTIVYEQTLYIVYLRTECFRAIPRKRNSNVPMFTGSSALRVVCPEDFVHRPQQLSAGIGCGLRWGLACGSKRSKAHYESHNSRVACEESEHFVGAHGVRHPAEVDTTRKHQRVKAQDSQRGGV